MSQVIDGFQRGDAAVIGPRMEALLDAGQQVTLQISGDSMRPTLKPRLDAAVLEKLSAWPPRRGDILFFKRENGEYVLHRVRRVKEDGAIMNGDAQNWTEGPVTRDMAIAKAVALVRKGRVVDVNAPLYRAYVACWFVTRPIRWPLLAAWRAIKRLLGGK